MNYVSDTSWEKFVYGDIDYLLPRLVGAEASDKEAVKFKKMTYVEISLSVRNMGVIAATAVLAALGVSKDVRAATNTAVSTISNPVQSNLGEKLRRARDVMALSQQETADLLDVSLSTIQKVEGGETESPTPEVLQAYEDLFELEAFFTTEIGKRRFAISALLRSPLEAFYGMTAIEFAKETQPRGIRKILGTFKRIYT